MSWARILSICAAFQFGESTYLSIRGPRWETWQHSAGIGAIILIAAAVLHWRTGRKTS